jgi:hypothetical protein
VVRAFFILIMSLSLMTSCIYVVDTPPASTPKSSTPSASTPSIETPSGGIDVTPPASSTSSFNLPEVTLFTVVPANVPQSYPTKLKWEVKNATDVLIEPNIGVVSTSGSQDVKPMVTTTYKLTATNNQGSILATTTLTISGTLPSRDTPVVKQFTADPYVIKKGESATLIWKTISGSAVTIEGIGTVEAEGTRQVTPSETTTYNLLVTSTDGTQYQSTTVNVK